MVYFALGNSEIYKAILVPNEQRYPTAFKTSQVRIAASRLNKKFNKKIYFVSDKGMTDRCVVTRLQ